MNTRKTNYPSFTSTFPAPRQRAFRVSFGASLATAASLTIAAESTSPGVSTGAMLQTFLGLIFLLALFVSAAWMVRRLGGVGGMIHGQGPMKLITVLPISPRERILLIEVEDTWLVIGIVPGQIRTLHTLPKGKLPDLNGAGAHDNQFFQLLQKFTGKKADDKPAN